MSDDAPIPWWRRSWFLATLLVGATLLSYQPAWNGEPVFDDEDHLTPPELRSVDGLRRIWTEVGAVSQYYPVTHTAFWLQHRLWGDAMPGYHLLNILLHAGAALLLVRILKTLKVPGAWLAGAVFALHPVHAESVAWISELKNTLSGVCYFGAALAYLRFDVTRRRSFYVAALALFVAGVLAKAVIATLPAALLVVFWWQRGRIAWRQDVRPLLPFFVVGMAAGLFTAWVERKFIGAEGDAFDLTLVERGLMAGRVIWFYLGKLWWPANLTFIYPRWTIDAANPFEYGWLLALVVAGLAIWRSAVLQPALRTPQVLQARAEAPRYLGRGPLAALLLFVGTLFPVLGFLNVYPFLYSFVADHYQYLASVAVIVAASAGAALALQARGWWARPAGNFAAVAVLALLATLTWRQSRMYAGVETLWRTTLARNPASFVAHSNLANYLLQKGQVDEAIQHCEAAIALRPGFAEVHNNLGNALLAKGRADEAREHYQLALTIRPTLAVAHFNLGAILLRQGRGDEAAAYFEKAVALRPEFVKPRVNLGRIRLEQGRVDEAIAHLEKALAARPDDADAHNNLGNALLRTGRVDAALAHYQQVLAADPRNVEAQHNLGSALLEKGQVDEAIARFRQATEIQPSFAPAHHALGVIFLQTGRPDQAIVCFKRALSFAPDFAAAHYQCGNALLQKGRLDEAVLHLQKAVALQPSLPGAFNDLGVVLAQQGKADAALASFQKALAQQPDSAAAHNNIGRIRLQRGEAREAMMHYRSALRLQPDDPDTLANLAWTLATAPDASLRSAPQALELAQRANQLAGGQHPLVLRALAAACAENGRFAEAVTAVEGAIALARAVEDKGLAGDLEAQRERYRSGAPFRDGAGGNAAGSPRP